MQRLKLSIITKIGILRRFGGFIYSHENMFCKKGIVLPETVTTVSRMVTIISRSLHNDIKFSKVKEIGIT